MFETKGKDKEHILMELNHRKFALEKALQTVNQQIHEVELGLIPEFIHREDGWNVEHEGTIHRDDQVPVLCERERIFD